MSEQSLEQKEDGSVTLVLKDARKGSAGGLDFLYLRYYDRIRKVLQKRMKGSVKTLGDEEDVALESMTDTCDKSTCLCKCYFSSFR